VRASSEAEAAAHACSNTIEKLKDDGPLKAAGVTEGVGIKSFNEVDVSGMSRAELLAVAKEQLADKDKPLVVVVHFALTEEEIAAAKAQAAPKASPPKAAPPSAPGRKAAPPPPPK